jgi:MoxR-like ATPase
MRLRLGYPTMDEEDAIVLKSSRGDPVAALAPVIEAREVSRMQAQTDLVRMSDEVRRYLLSAIRMTRSAPEIRLGGSPRASVALFRGARALAWVRGRDYVRPDDIKELLPLILGHRIVLSTEARLKIGDPDVVLKTLIEQVPVPVEDDEEPASHA